MLKTLTSSGSTVSAELTNMKYGRTSLQVVSESNAQYTVQHSLNGIDWLDHDGISEFTGSTSHNYAYPVGFIRLVVHSIAEGQEVKLIIMYV